MAKTSYDPSVISITAHYTAYAWYVGGFAEAERFVTERGRWLYRGGEVLMAPWKALGIPNITDLFLIPRHKMIDHLAREAGCRQYVELAAGLSPRGAAFTADPAVRYIEGDLPDMIALKRSLVERAGRRPNHFFETVNLLEQPLEIPSAQAERTVVITEGLANYFPTDTYGRMLRGIVEFLRPRGGGVYLADMHDRAQSRAYGVASRFFQQLVNAISRTKTVMHFEDPAEGKRFFEDAGFDKVEVLSPRDYARELGFTTDMNRDTVHVYRAEVSGT